jgi:hypothetical protein
LPAWPHANVLTSATTKNITIHKYIKEILDREPPYRQHHHGAHARNE